MTKVSKDININDVKIFFNNQVINVILVQLLGTVINVVNVILKCKKK